MGVSGVFNIDSGLGLCNNLAIYLVIYKGV